ncbi:MAG TPA: lipid-A-disaccharide synthase, partial [Candidatus Angelobacter sp.]|nr:lipid-A-disaccharide synthase [Candidatus Angelobacter sp.]
MQFLLSAGEASGDTYGSQLIESLRQLAAGSAFFGMGGEKMRASGAELLVNASEVAVVGLVEVVTHLPAIRRRFKHLVAEAARRKPDAAILIDFPDFNLRLARELHRLGIPVFYFVSPQIWAWRTGRVQQIKKYVCKMIVIFPFEQEFYRRHGVEVSYVGHPLAYAPPPQISREEFAATHHLDPKKQWIALLPGSRRKEVRLNLPPMIEAARLLQNQSSELEFLLPVASTLSKDWLREQLALLIAGWSRPSGPSVPEQRSPNTGWSRPSGLRSEPLKNPALAAAEVKAEGTLIHLTDNARATFMHSRAAVVASGTATVEAALSGTPFIVVYRLAPLTWLLGRRLVKLDTFAMPNLIAGKKIVTELIQKDFTAQNVVRELNSIIPDGPARRQMEAALKMVQQRLHDTQDAEPPAH